MSDVLKRLESTAARIAAYQADLRTERARRAALIREARPGIANSYREVARAARLSTTRVATIAGESDREDG